MRFAIDGETGYGDGGVEFGVSGMQYGQPKPQIVASEQLRLSPGQLDPTHKPGHEQGSAFASDKPTTTTALHLLTEIERIRASARLTEPTDLSL